MTTSKNVATVLVTPILALAVLAAFGMAPAEARQTPAAPPPSSTDGPIAPIPPAVVVRDTDGRATLRAIRLEAPLRIDGALDESLYDGPSISGFVQVEPTHGAPASEQTEVWVAFDGDHVYLTFRCWDSAPGRRVSTEMRRDVGNFINGNDILNIFVDPYLDRRNGLSFTVNSLGARNDGQQVAEQYNADWNPIWNHAVGTFDGGWTVEMALPFRSIRYRPGRAQLWGLNVLRTVRWKNELSVLTPVPAGRGNSSAQYAPLTATVVGIEAPPPAMNLDIKPYAITTLTSTPDAANELGADAGLDVKYSITQNLTADFTYNSDFAQVEADEQQVNLTRFSLFFPEKREFFLENRDTFSFGGVGTGGDAPVLFYSRRIGLDAGRAAPINMGGRLTGRVGRNSLGAIHIQTDAVPEAGVRTTDFSVVRLRRDILNASTLGVMATRRSVGPGGAGTGLAYGVDGTFNFVNDLYINTYWARTENDNVKGTDLSYRANLNFNSDRYGVQLERLRVGERFDPTVGFVRRPDVRRSLAELRFSPRPRSRPSIRRFVWVATVDYFENGAGRVDTRDQSAEFATEFQNGDRIGVTYNDAYEFVPEPFRIAPGVTIPVGAYDWRFVRVAFNSRPQRRAAANVSFEHGTFYDGHRTSLSVSRGRLALTPRFSVEPTYSLNDVELPQGSFTAHLAGSRVIVTMSPRMFVSALAQYNSTSNVMTANVRLRWEYQPGSELFVVYNDERDTLSRGFPKMMTRSFVIKINRLFRF